VGSVAFFAKGNRFGSKMMSKQKPKQTLIARKQPDPTTDLRKVLTYNSHPWPRKINPKINGTCMGQW
jgi:hypothetical protein